MIYTIEKVLKTKSKKIYETNSLEAMTTRVKEMGFTGFRKPYIFTCILCDLNGDKYGLCEFHEMGNGEKIIVSPQELEKIYIK